jgi:hypothetical protein
MSQFPQVAFTNLSPEMASKKFLWNFGDGSFDSVVHPVHTYINDTVYKVCLMIRDVINPSCFDTYCRLINSDVPGCNGSFLFSLDSLYSGPGFRMNYFSQSNYTNPNTIFLWTFGDGDSSTQKNPQHIYSQMGRYNVCLSIMNLLDSCFITDCKMVAVPDSLSNALPERLSNAQFHVFPNPVGSILIIESKAKAMNDLSFSLIDLSGKELLKLENLNPLSSYCLEIPMQDFDHGIYFLRIQGKEGILVYKLVK